jgi:AraC-like DNA-binding protein
MNLNETGVIETSVKYFCTPSDLAKKILFYITRCGHYFCSKEYVFTWNSSHGQIPTRLTYLLFFINSGSMTIFYDKRTQRAAAGQVVLIDCHKPHKYWANENLDFIWVHLDGSNIRQFYEEITRTHGHIFYAANKEVLHPLMESIIAAGRSGGAGAMEADRSRLVYNVLCELLVPTMAETSEKADNTVVKARKYIDANIQKNISVEMVADYVNISVSHLFRLFKQWTGCSPHKYIVLERINRAKHLLCTTTLSVKEVSYAVGFNNETNFIIAFTSKAGVSPTNFRKGRV